MNEQTLIIECGVADTRAALLDNDRAVRFWFGPARGDEGEDTAPRPGRRFAGRVRAINTALAAAFVDIGDGADSYLPIKKSYAEKITEGALIEASVKTPPRQNKGALLKFARGETNGVAGPGRLAPFDDAALEAVKQIGTGAGEIIVDDGRAAAALKAAELDARIEYEERSVSLFEAFGADAELETAFDRVAPIAGGGRLVIDETQALVAIDVDTSGLSASSPARLCEKVAIAAAYEASRQINLRNIGGHIVIDFPALETKGSRERFRVALKDAMQVIDGAGARGMSKSGLYSFTAPHGAQSLLERFTEPAPATPISGRRFTLDWLAKSALRRLEKRLRAVPSGQIELTVGKDLELYLSDRKYWQERLRERYGARFTLRLGKYMDPRRYELTE